jgi:hypothetical protein
VSIQSKQPKKLKFQSELPRKVSDEADESIRLDEVPAPDFDMTYRHLTTKILKYLTITARKLPEFRNFMQFVKTNLDVNHCSFFQEYSMPNGFTIELHHHPFSLYDICEAVAMKYMEKQGYIETFIVAEEVVMLHYRFLVGLTPLNPTAHDLVHAGELAIDPSMIVGNWKDLYGEYLPYLGEAPLAKCEALFALEKKGENPVFPTILETKPLRVYVKGISNVIDSKKLETLMITNRLQSVDQLEHKEVL